MKFAFALFAVVLTIFAISHVAVATNTAPAPCSKDCGDTKPPSPPPVPQPSPCTSGKCPTPTPGPAPTTGVKNPLGLLSLLGGSKVNQDASNKNILEGIGNSIFSLIGLRALANIPIDVL